MFRWHGIAVWFLFFLFFVGLLDQFQTSTDAMWIDQEQELHTVAGDSISYKDTYGNHLRAYLNGVHVDPYFTDNGYDEFNGASAGIPVRKEGFPSRRDYSATYAKISTFTGMAALGDSSGVVLYSPEKKKMMEFDEVQAIYFSCDDEYLVIKGSDETSRIHIPTLTRVPFEARSRILPFCMSPDQKWILIQDVYASNELKIKNAVTHRTARCISVPFRVLFSWFSLDGTLLFCKGCTTDRKRNRFGIFSLVHNKFIQIFYITYDNVYIHENSDSFILWGNFFTTHAQLFSNRVPMDLLCIFHMLVSCVVSMEEWVDLMDM